MKKFFLLILATAWIISAFGQQTDASLTTQSNVIKNETTAGGNTKTRIAAMYQSIIDSKVSRGEMITATGTDTYIATGNSTLTLSANFLVVVKFTNANTGASTLNVNSLGDIAIKKNGTTALSSGDIPAGAIRILVYDGTNFQITGDGGGIASVAWGDITGTLSNQADLSAQFANYYTSAQTDNAITTSKNSIQTYTFNDQVGDYTLALTDFDTPTFLRVTKTGTVTITVPANASVAVPVGRALIVKKVGTSDITYSPAGGVTIVPSNGAYTSAPNQQIVLLKEGTNSWGLYNGIAVDATSLGLVPNTRQVAGYALSADVTVDNLITALVIPKRVMIASGADVTTNSTTYSDLTSFSFAVTSGVKYEFKFHIPYKSSASTEGSLWALNGPTATYLQYDVTANNTSSARFFELSHSTYDPTVTPSATTNTAVAGNNICIIEGVIVPSANGTLQVRFATENGGAQSISVKRNGYDSWYEYTIIP